jgi:hypothetical protein
MVPIKDPSFIGRKIDCPKCKYRFVVEDPSADTEADDEAEAGAPAREAAAPAKKGAKATGVTAQKPANGQAAAAKKKPGAKVRREAEAAPGEAPAKKKKPSMTLMLGIGGAAVGVLLLAVCAYFLFFTGGSSTTPPKPPPGPRGGGTTVTTTNPTNPANPGEGDQAPEGEAKQAVVPPPAAEVTNYLPNEAEAVMSINVERLVNSAAKKAAFFTPGAFRPDAFQNVMGFPFEKMVRVVWSAHHFGRPDGWQFTVVRTSTPVTLATLKNLKLVKDPKGPIEGYDFFTVTGEMDSLSRFLFTRQCNKPLAVHLIDDKTLVLAHEEPMRAFLTAKRAPMVLAEAPGAAGEEPAAKPPAEGQPKGPAAPGAGAPASGSPAPGAGGPPNGPPNGPPAPGGAGAPAAPAKPAPRPAVAPGSYTTIKPDLKAMLDQLEAGKEPVILSLAAEVQVGMTLLQLRGQDALLSEVWKIQQLDQVTVIGLALQQLTTNRIAGLVGYQCKSEKVAEAAEKAVREAGPALAEALGDELNLKIHFPTEEPAAPSRAPFPGPGMGGTMGPMGRGPMGPGAYGPGMGYGGGRGPGGGGAMGPMGRGGPMGGGIYGPGMGYGGGVGGPMPPRAGEPTPGEGEESRPGKDASTITVRLNDRTLILGFDLNLKDNVPVYEHFLNAAGLLVLQAKGREDMSGRSRIHDLAEGLRRYVKANGAFPRGTAERPPVPARRGVPWPPDQRVSWMAEVLPFLGRGEFADVANRVQRDKAWNDPDNLQSAQTLIPYYLAHDYPQSTWWTTYPGVLLPVANTHFVGVAGLGLDAAEYAATDPAAAKQLGVFGYDRSTRPAEIKDGPDKTIVVLQVPASYRTPWLAGGGSTVRGVADKASVRPFVCTTYEGKPGTFAIMADFKVRFIPATISDKDFQALCTINGGEKVDVDKVAPVVPAPDLKAELKTPAPAAPAVTPPKVPAATTSADTPPAKTPAASPAAAKEEKKP